jgi:excisionase family DNA binding protein
MQGDGRRFRSLTNQTERMMPANLLTRDEAAQRCRICTRTLDRAIDANQIRHIRIGRRILVAESDLAAWLDARAVPCTDAA